MRLSLDINKFFESVASTWFSVTDGAYYSGLCGASYSETSLGSSYKSVEEGYVFSVDYK
jgi:hypothetical protein